MRGRGTPDNSRVRWKKEKKEEEEEGEAEGKGLRNETLATKFMRIPGCEEA